MPVPYGRAKSGGNPALHCLAPLQSLLARLAGGALAPPELSEAAGPLGDKPMPGSRPPFRPASKHAFDPQKQKVPYAPGAENRHKLTVRMALPARCHTKFRNLTNHIRVRCWHSFYLAFIRDRTFPQFYAIVFSRLWRVSHSNAACSRSSAFSHM